MSGALGAPLRLGQVGVDKVGKIRTWVGPTRKLGLDVHDHL